LLGIECLNEHLLTSGWLVVKACSTIATKPSTVELNGHTLLWLKMMLGHQGGYALIPVA